MTVLFSPSFVEEGRVLGPAELDKAAARRSARFAVRGSRTPVSVTLCRSNRQGDGRVTGCRQGRPLEGAKPCSCALRYGLPMS